MKARIAIITILAMGAALFASGPGSAMNIGGYQPRAWRITGLDPADPTPNFHYPFGIALNDAGDVFVTDSMNDTVLKFANDGTYLDRWGGHGTGPGEFDRPTGIGVSPAGDVFVVDTMNNRVQVFGPGGAYLDQWGTAGRNGGEFNHPIGIAISDADKAYVADTFNHRIEKFDLDGTFLTEFGEPGSGGGRLNHPVGVATDQDHVYVTDNGNRLVQIRAAGRSRRQRSLMICVRQETVRSRVTRRSTTPSATSRKETSRSRITLTIRSSPCWTQPRS